MRTRVLSKSILDTTGRVPFLCSNFVLFIVAFCSRFVIHLVGEFSPTFLFATITLPWYVNGLKMSQDKMLKKTVLVFCALMLLGVVWTPFSDTDLVGNIKSIMIPFNGLIVFLFFYYAYTKNPSGIKWAVLGTFISQFFIRGQMLDNSGIEAGTYNYWKFLVFPRIVTGVVCLYLFAKWRLLRDNISWIMIFVGLLGLATGARSTGLVALIPGLLALFIQRPSFKARNLKKYAIIGFIGFYAVYALFYVPRVLDGTIKEGNSEQLLKTDNPYNPFNLIMIGRADSVVPFMAFFDKPIFGWGTSAKDTPDFHYIRMTLALQDADNQSDDFGFYGDLGTIPGHSIWGTYSCWYGLFGFFTILMLVVIMLKASSKCIKDGCDVPLYVLFTVFGFVWTILFSPIANLKTMTGSIAIILALAFLAEERNKIKNIENE